MSQTVCADIAGYKAAVKPKLGTQASIFSQWGTFVQVYAVGNDVNLAPLYPSGNWARR